MTVRILQVDCRDGLKTLPDESVHCVVTSPPYWLMRDYGCIGQLGLESTPSAFVDALVGVFSEARRVLRGDGTLWLNLGDSYAQSEVRHRNGSTGTMNGPETGWNAGTYQVGRKLAHGLEPKNLIGIPWRVAFALQADGWYLRQDIIWSKPNPMPESVRDRCTKAHEYIFLLSKSERYYFDADAIAEPAAIGARRFNGAHTGNIDRQDNGRQDTEAATERNKRSVWTVTTKPFSEAHFATFPTDLIEPCILAGCPVGGTVLDPFGGAGTTGLVADRLGRNAILIELNPEYAEMARKRIYNDAPLFAEVR